MSEKSRLKIILTLTIIILAGLSAFLIWFLWGGKKIGIEHEKGRPLEQAAGVQQEKEGVVTIGINAQKRGDIAAAPVKAMAHTEKIRAYGIVLQLQNLSELRNNYVQAKTQVEKALTNLDLSKKEYARLKALNEDNKNVSDKALQAAGAKLHNDEKNVYASREALDILEDTVHQQWGSVLAGQLLSGSAAFRRLVQQKDVLIQLTLPAGARITRMPESISLVLADGSTVSASFISLSPRTDPSIQGTSLFYAAPSVNGKLVTRMNVTADLPSGPPAKGVFIPDSSIVLWQGKSWVFIKQDAEHYVRREVSVDIPVNNGYFSAKNFRPGEQIVVKGAQVLLSEESRSKTQAREED